MAIKRHSKTTTNLSDKTGTSVPDYGINEGLTEENQTADIYQVEAQYNRDAESNNNDRFDTGALLPKDLTVRLVRSESANWETFLSVLYSITLTLFGLFLGSWLSSSAASVKFTSLESVATIAFGFLSLALIIVWIILKVKQQRHGIKVPYNLLNTLTEDKAEQ
jgi:hypothetical protein